MNIAVYCGSNPGNNPHFTQAAYDLGKWIGESGNSLVYGGSSVGLMGIVSSETLAAGGKAYGVETGFFCDAGVAQHDLTELYVVETMDERKAKMIELADTFVALPGGIGTIEEISEVMTRVRLGFDPPECYFLNIDHYYDKFREFLESMRDEGFIDQIDLDRYYMPASVEELAVLIEENSRKPKDKPVTVIEFMQND